MTSETLANSATGVLSFQQSVSCSNSCLEIISKAFVQYVLLTDINFSLTGSSF